MEMAWRSLSPQVSQGRGTSSRVLLWPPPASPVAELSGSWKLLGYCYLKEDPNTTCQHARQWTGLREMHPAA